MGSDDQRVHTACSDTGQMRHHTIGHSTCTADTRTLFNFLGAIACQQCITSTHVQTSGS